MLEKEVLHNDIMLVLHKEGILQHLTFICGASLRLCYNSSRLSEDLDFTAGFDFNPNKFDGLEKKLEEHLHKNSPMAGIPIAVQSMAEILADKMVAFAYRERRIKPRDVWDIVWLKQQGVEQRYDLIIKKLEARGKEDKDFIEKINQHLRLLQKNESTKSDFYNDMSRFLPIEIAKRTLENNNFWPYLVLTVGDELKQVTNNLSGNSPKQSFDMKM